MHRKFLFRIVFGLKLDILSNQISIAEKIRNVILDDIYIYFLDAMVSPIINRLRFNV